MSVDIYVVGIIPADEKHKEMFNLYKQCEETGVIPPEKIIYFFGGEDVYPDPDGYEIQIPTQYWREEETGQWGYKFDISKIPNNVKYIKVGLC